MSDATNLVPSDANAKRDAFLHRRSTGATSRVSVGDDEQEGNGEVESAAVSADGRYVAFASHASNLVVDDTNHAVDVFVRDTQLDTTRRVSLSDGGAQAGAYSGGPSISADGRYVAFTTDAALAPGDTNEASVAVGDDIHYGLTVENTGDVVLTGVSVTDPAVPGCDTVVATLAVGAQQTVECAHTAVEADAGTFSNTASAHADQTAPVASNQVDVSVTTRPRPDLVIRRKGGPRAGAGIVDADAAGQTVTVGRTRGGRGVFYVLVVNAGLEPGTFRVVRVGAADPHVSMRVFQGRSSVEVTDQILRHAYRTRSLAPGEAMTLRIELSVGAGAAHGATVVALLRARSDGPTVHSDTVGAAVRVR